MRTKLRAISCLAVLFAGAGLSAQIWPSQPGQWVKEHFLIQEGFPSHALLLDAGNQVMLKIPSLKEAPNFPLPPEQRAMNTAVLWFEGAYFACAFGKQEFDTEGKAFDRFTLAKDDGQGWRRFAELKTARDVGLLKFIPCTQGRFIGISSKEDLSGAKAAERSPFYRLRKATEGLELERDGVIAPGLEGLKRHLEWFTLPAVSPIVMLGHHAVVLNRLTGLYWIFSLEKADLVHSGRLFPKVTDEMISKGGFADAVYSLHPEKDGTLLVAAQSEEHFTQEKSDPSREVAALLKANPSLTAKDATRIFSQKQQDAAQRSPFICWYRIDPEKGTVKRLVSAPPGAQELREGGKPVAWRPLPDGSVRMGGISPKELVSTR